MSALNELENTDNKIIIKKANKSWYKIVFKFNIEVIKQIKKTGNNKKDWLYDPKKKEWYVHKSKLNEIKEKLKSLEKEENFEENIKKRDIKFINKVVDYNKLKNIKPYKHQVEAAQFLIEGKKVMLCDEMGGGKTLSSIMAAMTLPAPRLIICPASIKINWSLEIAKADINTSIERISIINTNKKLVIDKDKDWIIINYDMLNKYMHEIKKINWSCIIIDEAHYIKSVGKGGKATSKRAINTIEISKNIENTYLLTGTPMTSRPKDLFNLLKIIDHPCAKDWIGYAYAYCGPEETQYGTSFNGASNIDNLHKKIKPYMLRRLKKDMLDLPDKTRTFNYVEINLKEYKKELEIYMKNKKYFVNIGEALLKLNKMKMIIAEQKVKHTIEMIKSYMENNESIVVISNYKNVIEKIIEMYKKDSVKLIGESNQKQRQKAVEEFQNGEKKIFVGNIIAAGTGITLTKASNMIINDMDWLPANHLQVEDRIHRIGQNNKCNIIYQVAKGAEIDEIMASALSEKLSNINAVIDNYNGEDGKDFNMAARVIREINY